jgi:hypothetical protein
MSPLNFAKVRNEAIIGMVVCTHSVGITNAVGLFLADTLVYG